MFLFIYHYSMKNSSYKILLVEDDATLGYLLSEYLGMKNFEITWAKNSKEALEALEILSHDLAILDVMLPDMDGFTLAERLQFTNPELPFIFLSARSLKTDVLKGFSLGAVDYLKKPIDEEELVARINALLARIMKSEVPEPETEKHKIGLFEFNSKIHELQFENETISLTVRENELLAFLNKNRNNLCSHKDILIHLWGKNDYFNRKSLNVFISHLRKYLSRDPSVKIENLHKRGFILKVMEN